MTNTSKMRREIPDKGNDKTADELAFANFLNQENKGQVSKGNYNNCRRGTQVRITKHPGRRKGPRIRPILRETETRNSVVTEVVMRILRQSASDFFYGC